MPTLNVGILCTFLMVNAQADVDKLLFFFFFLKMRISFAFHLEYVPVIWGIFCSLVNKTEPVDCDLEGVHSCIEDAALPTLSALGILGYTDHICMQVIHGHITSKPVFKFLTPENI